MSGAQPIRGSVTLSVRALLAVVVLALAAGALAAALLRRPDRAAAGEPPGPAPAPAWSFATAIRPILDAKCAQCHGAEKQKGKLSFETPEKILAGGRDGPVLDRAAPERSALLARLRLPLEHDDHMPPADEPQLAPDELAALERWVLAGAPFDGASAHGGAPPPASAPVPGAPAGALAAETAPGAPRAPETAPGAPKAIPPADPAALQALRDALVHVQPLGEGSPLLWVDCAAAARVLEDARARELLEPVRAQLAEVALARSGVGDATLALLATFPRLRRLDVRATAVGDAGVAALAGHAELAELVLAQTRLTDASVEHLLALPALARVHLWRSGISAEGLARLRAARPQLSIEDGAGAPGAALEAEPPVALAKSPPAAPGAPVGVPGGAPPSLAPVNAKCPVSGAAVRPEFAVVHAGRVIGFCCANCPKEFWAEPAKFLDRLD